MNYSPRSALLAVTLAVAACSQPPVTDEDAAVDAPQGADVVVTDTVITEDAPAPRDVPTDSMPGACGAERPTITGIRGTEGLVIGPDGTIYYSQSGAVGRMRPGMAPEGRWVVLPAGSTTVWGLALDVPRNRLYAGSQTAGTVYSIDLAAAAPAATALENTLGAPNGLTIGPDGDLYYTDFSGGHVHHVTPDGADNVVTTSRIASANGLAFGPDGSLYVVSYSNGVLFRLTLTGGMESARAPVAMGLGRADGLALDARGRFYITDQMAGRLVRLDADGTNPTDLLTGMSGPANVDFGTGPLNCQDIYVAVGGGSLRRFEMGDERGADVPWHR